MRTKTEQATAIKPLCKLGICDGTGLEYVEDDIFTTCECGIVPQIIANDPLDPFQNEGERN